MAGHESAPTTASEDDRSPQTTPLVALRIPPVAPGPPDASELPPEGGALYIVSISGTNANSQVNDAAAQAAASVETLHLESTGSGQDGYG